MRGAIGLVGTLMLAGLLTAQQEPPLAPSDEEPKKEPATPKVSPDEAERQLLERHGVAATEKGLVAFFRARTLPESERADAKRWVEELASPDFRVRERAASALLKRGASVLELLRLAEKNADLELARRAEQLVSRIWSPESIVDLPLAALRRLEKTNAPDAIAALLGFLPGAGSDFVSDEVRATIQRLAGKKAPPELIAALTDAHPIRRAAAGTALAGGPADAEVQKLLDDADPIVRARVSQVYVARGRKSAVPILIDALSQVPDAHAFAGHDLLFRVAEGRSPPNVSRGADDASRRKFRDAWHAWWAKHRDAVDLASLSKTPDMLGHTVVVLLDLGRVIELNAKNEVVWQIEGVSFPLDVQFLPSGNVLLAEYHANRVCERDRFRGEIRWEKQVTAPLVAQRLPNGATFVATDSQFFEFDEKGVERLSFSMPGGERIMKAAKLPSGEVAMLTTEGRVVRMDEKGRELGSFSVDLSTRLFGGRIHMLPNGRVLVPMNAENRVVEFDAQGQAVWEVSVPQPVAATRLANGNTLVTTMQPQTGAIEFDRQGREVWSYRHNTRVTRALRR